MLHYTRNGFLKAAENFREEDMIADVSNLSYMITGANSGIGKETALALAKRGATVHMVCRNSASGEQVKQEIISQSGNNKVHLHILDMAKPRNIVEFTASFVRSEAPLDVLVNNAGCMVNQRELSEDGLETNFATNTLGTYIITTELIPVLGMSASARVVTVSSGGMLTTKLETVDLQSENCRSFDGTFAYAQNKRQQVVMSRIWSKQFPNIHFSTMHPGWADTPAVRSAMPSFHRLMEGKLRTPEQGADTIIWLCVAPRDRVGESGLFFQDRTPVSEHLPLAWTRSGADEERILMTKLEELKQRFQQQQPPTASTQPAS
ncbi:hypothetical protein EMCRGX_G026204 [Ephydatia muelleri]